MDSRWVIMVHNVIIDVTREGVNDKLERWRHTLESRGFRASRSKTECLHCCFSEREDARREVTIEGMTILKVEKFKYREVKMVPIEDKMR